MPDIVSRGVVMRRWWGIWAVVLGASGCCASGSGPPRPAAHSVAPVAVDLPLTTPTVPVLDAKSLPKLPPRSVTGPQGSAFRRLTEADCLVLAAANASPANRLDEENRVPAQSKDCESPADRLRQTLRYYAALESRNRAAADALDRYFQLCDVEARTDLLRKAFPVLDPLHEKARAAKAQDVRYPLDPADLERQRSQLVSQLEQAELGARLLNLDLKNRLGLPYPPADERLWPSGDFAIDPTPSDPDAASNAALADRPELRGLRALHAALTPETLPDVRDYLRAGNPLLGSPSGVPGLSLAALVHRLLHHKQAPDPAAVAELEVRRKQLGDLIADRERTVADEARAAALMVNSQRVRATLARDRLLGWEEKLAEAVKKREANQPGAEFLEPQARQDWLKAKAEVVAEVAAWHQARIKLRAAMGWLAWEAVGNPPSGEKK